MIVARVQAHPSRADSHRTLVKSLEPLSVELRVHSSDPPDPWAGYVGCLRDLPSCSHALVIQDDALPCKNFVPALERVAERYPDTPVCLFMGTMPASTVVLAMRAWGKKLYVPLLPAPFVPLVAVLWPVEKAREFLLWSKTSRRMTRADDGNVARWKRECKQEFMVTVPSLVQHNDFIPSVKGGRSHIPGHESWRRALFLAEDGLDYDW